MVEQLPSRVTVATARVLALLELANWGARSEADRLLVNEMSSDLQRLAVRYAAAREGVQDATGDSGLTGSATGAESAGAGDGDGGGAGTESHSPGGGMVGSSQ